MIRKLKRKILRLVSALLENSPIAASCSGLGHILMFHQFCRPHEVSRLEMRGCEASAEILEAVIQFYLERGIEIISLDEVHRRLTTAEPTTRFVALTFDDAYRSFVTLGYPVLKRHKAPFTIYVVSNYAQGITVKWDYLLEKIVACNENVELRENGHVRYFNCSHDRLATLRKLYEVLQKSNNDKSLHLIEEFVGRYLPYHDLNPHNLMLSWGEIIELARDPLVCIGAHTVNHFVLSSLNESTAREEISQSKEQIQQKLGREIRHFAYPYGERRHATIREYNLAQRCGFLTAVTSLAGNLCIEHSKKLYQLPRYNINLDIDNDYLSGINSGALEMLTFRP